MDNTKILTKIIELLREEGVKIDSPYDLENWLADHAQSHSDMFQTGLFKEED